MFLPPHRSHIWYNNPLSDGFNIFWWAAKLSWTDRTTILLCDSISRSALWGMLHRPLNIHKIHSSDTVEALNIRIVYRLRDSETQRLRDSEFQRLSDSMYQRHLFWGWDLSHPWTDFRSCFHGLGYSIHSLGWVRLVEFRLILSSGSKPINCCRNS